MTPLKHFDDFTAAEQALVEKLVYAVGEKLLSQHEASCPVRGWWTWLAVSLIPGIVGGIVVAIVRSKI